MTPKIGTTLTHLPIKELTKVRDLEFFEGPLLSEYRTPRGDLYLYSWCDTDANVTRWMVFRTSRSDLAKYTNQLLTFLELIKSCQDGFVYFIDIDPNGRTQSIQLSTLDEIPDDYMPDPSACFDSDLMPKKSRIHDILLDGEWELKELSDFQRDYKDVYSFLYVLGQNSSEPNNDVYIDHNVRDGKGYVVRLMYNSLGSRVPPQDRPHVEALQYASPGVMSIRLNHEAAAIIPLALARFSELSAELSTAYDRLNDLVRSRSNEGATSYMEQETEAFAELLGFLNWKRIKTSAQTAKQVASILLVYYRSLQRLLKFQKKGMAVIL